MAWPQPCSSPRGAPAAAPLSSARPPSARRMPFRPRSSPPTIPSRVAQADDGQAEAGGEARRKPPAATRRPLQPRRRRRRGDGEVLRTPLRSEICSDRWPTTSRPLRPTSVSRASEKAAFGDSFATTVAPPPVSNDNVTGAVGDSSGRASQTRWHTPRPRRRTTGGRHRTARRAPRGPPASHDGQLRKPVRARASSRTASASDPQPRVRRPSRRMTLPTPAGRLQQDVRTPPGRESRAARGRR